MANPNPQSGFRTNPQNINKDGRPPKEWTWSGLIKEALEETDLEGREVKKKVTQSLVNKALEGDVQALKEIGNRIDGMPQQKTDITTNGKDLPTPILGGITKNA